MVPEVCWPQLENGPWLALFETGRVGIEGATTAALAAQLGLGRGPGRTEARDLGGQFDVFKLLRTLVARLNTLIFVRGLSVYPWPSGEGARGDQQIEARLSSGVLGQGHG